MAKWIDTPSGCAWWSHAERMTVCSDKITRQESSWKKLNYATAKPLFPPTDLSSDSITNYNIDRSLLALWLAKNLCFIRVWNIASVYTQWNSSGHYLPTRRWVSIVYKKTMHAWGLEKLLVDARAVSCRSVCSFTSARARKSIFFLIICISMLYSKPTRRWFSYVL